MKKDKYYITTAIAYTSKKPHIGNTYEAVLTDAIARFKRQIGHDVFFLTGTDEHGQKIQELAKNNNMSPKAYVDVIAGEIKEIWDMMNTSYDKFIRTTDDYHEKVVQKIFKKLYDQGDIYKGEYEGLYCVPDESFYTESQLVNGKCPECGREVEKTKEEAYFLKLSKYQDWLIDYIETHPDFIQPESRKKEMLNNFLKPGLQDLCVSRTSFNWGIPVDFDDKHVVYVWIDALSNYITALGYDPDGSGELYNKYWPADVHVIGKDILRFHTIYWPIMLKALDIPMPKQIFGHPWLLSGNDKMSKSIGNVIYAEDLVKQFGVDAIRYYLLHEMPFAQDGTITYETIISRFNSELANTLGNLVNRTVAMVNKYFGGEILEPKDKEEIDEDLIRVALEAPVNIEKKMEELKVADAMDEIWNLIKRSNKYIDETMPWILGKDEDKKDRLATVLYNLVESIRMIGVMLSSFMPDTSDKIMHQINAKETTWDSILEFGKTKIGSKVGDAVPLFIRLDEKKKLEEILEENKKNNIISEPKKEVEKMEGKIEDEFITIEDFDKIELKVGEVIECKQHENADKLLVSQIKIGDETRQIVSGIAKWFTPEDMVGRKVIVVTNLKPVKLRGVESQGMILAADKGEALALLTADIENGAEVR